MEVKVCCKCKEEKSIVSFYERRERGLNERRSKCIDCCKKYKHSLEKQREYDKKSYQKNRQKRIEKSRKYRVENKDKVIETEKKRREKHKDKRLEFSVNYTRERRKTDPLFYLRHQISNNIYSKLKNAGKNKKSKTEDILGCDILFFKKHIESQFSIGMSWDNHGEWHLDHIIPCSIAKNESELLKLNHYSNFQPLWAIDNLKKGNKLTK